MMLRVWCMSCHVEEEFDIDDRTIELARLQAQGWRLVRPWHTHEGGHASMPALCPPHRDDPNPYPAKPSRRR